MSFEISKQNNNDDLESLEDLLEQTVEEIELDHLSVNDLVRITEIRDLIDNIKAKSPEVADAFEGELVEFKGVIYKAYKEEELHNCALYHVCELSELPPTVERLDLDGEYSIEDFLKGFINKYLDE